MAAYTKPFYRDRDIYALNDTTARKLTPPVLEAALAKQIQVLKSLDGKSIQQFLPGGTLKQLSCYADQTTAVLGYVLKTTLCEFAKVDSQKFPKDCTLYVTFEVTNVESTTRTFSSNERVYTQDDYSSHRKIHGYEWTGYGVNFDVEIKWNFRPTHGATPDSELEIVFGQAVQLEPASHMRQRIEVRAPPKEEFAIGAAINLLNGKVSAHEDSKCFPRHNSAVYDIEHSLNELCRLVDKHVRFFAPFLPAAVAHTANITIPWSIARLEDGKDSKDSEDSEDNVKMDTAEEDSEFGFLDKALRRALDQFHRDNTSAMTSGLGMVGDLLQRLMLLKVCAVHFKECYAAIDHVMVRSFLDGVGRRNAAIFEKAEPLDALLLKIANHQMSRAGIDTSAVELTAPGCALRVDVMIPGTNYYQPLHGITAVNESFEGTLCFGGSGTKGIRVSGHETRSVFSMPIESGGAKLPSFRLSAESEFNNSAVIVVIGTPDGASTRVKAMFLLTDAWYMRVGIAVASIPSNKAFNETMSVLPPEMADFASAIRECDVNDNGLDAHLIPARGPIAASIGIKEVDLMGDPEFEQRLVRCWRGGASLHSLAQTNPAGDPKEFSYDLAKLKAETVKLEKRLLEQGKIDHYVPGAQANDEQDDATEQPAPARPNYRSLGCLSQEVAAPAYTSCSAVPDTTMQQGAGGGDGDAVVDSLATDMNALSSDGKSFMKQMLKKCDGLSRSEAVLGAVLDVPNDTKSYLFAKAMMPDGISTSDMIAPLDAEACWKARPNLVFAANTLAKMLASYPGSVPTTRLTLFGAFVEWETNLLTALMSGSRDPTKLMLEVAHTLFNLQR